MVNPTTVKHAYRGPVPSKGEIAVFGARGVPAHTHTSFKWLPNKISISSKRNCPVPICILLETGQGGLLHVRPTRAPDETVPKAAETKDGRKCRKAMAIFYAVAITVVELTIHALLLFFPAPFFFARVLFTRLQHLQEGEQKTPHQHCCSH
ncbi:hypothetical protein BD289DRAFT_118262 [Coniella lustricola]|uniref:Uncharacterized protein n=1 Tax=Coniella lustricola TaxID=2025994 RepID=A0A2T3AFZ7_9PEZI|nr:hypothetical protein BD289DRAFT_118262 [Coniella lustricola]